MTTYRIKEDIHVLCVQAASFPDGIMAAYDKLKALLPATDKRMLYGISYPEKVGKIIYKAAAEAKFPGEGEQYNCESFILKKGDYMSEVVYDFMNHISSIGNTFQKMLQHPDLDPNGYCVEMYLNDKDVQCLVKLKDK